MLGTLDNYIWGFDALPLGSPAVSSVYKYDWRIVFLLLRPSWVYCISAKNNNLSYHQSHANKKESATLSVVRAYVVLVCLHLFYRIEQRTAIPYHRPWIATDWSIVHLTIQLMVRGKKKALPTIFPTSQSSCQGTYAHLLVSSYFYAAC